ncbi:hypothetical protein ACNQR7_07545 [Mycolicibacterium senegalense]|uniref:hypothetical protein n=1 Tax=Mycolicibacterium senegalense TaxID=1796 RepID=UPI003AAD9584
MAISINGDPADLAKFLQGLNGNANGGTNSGGNAGGGTANGSGGTSANTNSAGAGGSANGGSTSGGNTAGTNTNSGGTGGNSGGGNASGNTNSGGTGGNTNSGSGGANGGGTGNTVATNGSGGGGTNSGGGGGQPKTAPTTSTPTTPAPTPATPTPTTGEKVLSAVGLPKEELGKLKTEPLQGVKGLYKAQWMVAPNALGAAVAAPAVFKAGAEAAKQSGATDATIKAAKDAARLAASHGGKAMVAKGIGHMIPFIGSGIAALSAIDDFRNGRIVSGALNVLGIIPGPVGWVAMAAAAVWNAFGDDGIGKWDQPNGTDTWMLPASAKDISGVTGASGLDAALREAQRGVFRFEDGPKGTVWNSSPPAAIRIDGKSAATGSVVGVGLGVLDKVTGTASTDDIKALATSFFNGLSDHFAAIDKAMTDSGEPYFLEQRQALQPQLAAMAKLRDVVEPLMAQLGAASDGAAVRYQAVLDTNTAARKQLSEEGKLSDSGAATTMKTNLATGASAISAANDKLAQLCAETPPAVVMARGTTAPTGSRPAETKPQEVRPAPTPAVTPAPQTPAAQTPKSETPKNTDDLSKLLNQLSQQAKAPTSNPLSSTGSGLGGGSPLGSQGLGGGQGGGTPLTTSKPDTSTKSEEPKKLTAERPERKVTEPKKLSDDKSLAAPKPEQVKSTVPAEAKPAPAAGPVATPAPAAPTPAQQNAAHAAKAEEKPNADVDVKGTKATFPDAKTAALARTLAAADPTHPMSLADAAKQAGLTPPTPGQDPGKQVAPTDAKPGDLLVAGGKNYMLLGEGRFYDLSDYKVVGASEIPQQLGERAGYFHLVDPSPGSPAGQAVPGPQTPPAAPQGPVSPQSTAGVQFPVPGATGAPAGPVDAGAPPAAPGGVPAAGSPGVPKPGAPGSGPANAASTDTGVGVGGPTVGGQRLDPSAVR